MITKPWTIWITGLSGSGKTAISKKLIQLLTDSGQQVDYLRLDEVRQIITPNPVFSKEERDIVYRCSAYCAIVLNRHGINVVIDSVDGEGTGRELCRELIPNFGVIYVRCPLEVCIERETVRTDRAKIEKLYERAIQGELKIAGYGRPYAVEKSPLMVVDSDKLSIEESAQTIFKSL